jgi:phage tail sheath gpL-like
MGAGDTSVQIATEMTAAAIKTAVDAAITATGPAARLTITQINNGNIVVVANLIA